MNALNLNKKKIENLIFRKRKKKAEFLYVKNTFDLFIYIVKLIKIIKKKKVI